MSVMLFAAESDKSKFVELDVPTWAWAVLVVVVIALLALDLWRHRKAHEPTLSEAAKESAFWVFCGVSFAGFFLWQFGGEAAAEYVGVYVTEKALSVDNVFVWSLLFSSMAIPLKYQHRVLFWGIFGALVMRAAFIFAGAELVQRFKFTLVIFGLILIWTAIKIVRENGEEEEHGTPAALSWLKKVMPVTDTYDGQRFFTIIDGVRHATPLFAALVVVELTDVIFAFDSVPASFGVANEAYTIVSANAFAIMGLRAMYFLLAGAKEKFKYLSLALGGILLFVGIKLLLTPWYHMSIAVSLSVIFAILLIAIVMSIRYNKAQELVKN